MPKSKTAVSRPATRRKGGTNHASAKRVSTVTRALEALGGTASVAKWLGIDEGTICGWLMHKEIARSRALYIYLSLVARGYEPAPSLFGGRTWKTFVKPAIVPASGRRSVAPRARRAA